MAEQFELTQEMKDKIGWKSQPWTWEVTTTSVRAFARGVGYLDPVYYDIDAAKKAGYRNLPAPPTYLGSTVFIPGQTDDTLSIPPGFAPSLDTGMTGLLDGGTDTEYLETICAGDTLTSVNRLSDLSVKESKSLGKMLIISTETTFTNQDNTVVAIQRGQIIFY
jgi:hypothetical protein